MNDELLTVRELADRLKVDGSTVRRMSDAGQIPVALVIGSQRRYVWGDVRAALAPEPVAAPEQGEQRATPPPVRRARKPVRHAPVKPKLDVKALRQKAYGV